MPIRKTFSKTDKQLILPKKWTYVRFDDDVSMPPLKRGNWIILSIIIKVEYPEIGCPTTLKTRIARWPQTNKEDRTAYHDFDPIPGETRHHHFTHFLKNRKDMSLGLKIKHNGDNPITLDGRQFKWQWIR